MVDFLSPLPAALIPGPDVLPLTPAKEMMLRALLVSEALSWVGTPYRQMGATKGAAVDCSMLLVRAMVDAGIVEDFDPRPYPPLWFLHREDERYIEWLAKIAEPVEVPQPGDMIAYKIGRAFAHSGIIVDAEHLVHAFVEDGRCNVSPLRHPRLMFADRVGKVRRETRCFDLFARIRADHPG